MFVIVVDTFLEMRCSCVSCDLAKFGFYLSLLLCLNFQYRKQLIKLNWYLKMPARSLIVQ